MTVPSSGSPGSPGSKGEEVRRLFDTVPDYYDRMNRVMTLGRHAAWCRDVARRAQVPAGGSLLDIATGTGVIALEAARRYPGATVHGVDFSEGMLAGARSKPGADAVTWQFADANALPYDDESFDAVTHGYLLRNVEDAERVLAEQLRVLRPGGRVVVLETCPPRGLLRVPVTLGVKVMIPLLGQLVARDRKSYTYLEESTLGFMSPEQVADIMRRLGFVDVAWDRRFLGTHMILSARKP